MGEAKRRREIAEANGETLKPERIQNRTKKLQRVVEGFPIWQRQQKAQAEAAASIPKKKDEPTPALKRGISRTSGRGR